VLKWIKGFFVVPFFSISFFVLFFLSLCLNKLKVFFRFFLFFFFSLCFSLCIVINGRFFFSNPLSIFFLVFPSSLCVKIDKRVFCLTLFIYFISFSSFFLSLGLNKRKIIKFV
jgi:hypothetical protein